MPTPASIAVPRLLTALPALLTLSLVAPSVARAQGVIDTLGLGGELREVYESSRHPVFGLSQPDHDDRVLQRLLVHSDIRIGSASRAYVELVSGQTSGWDAPVTAQQNDKLDVLQAWGETTFQLGGKQSLGLRLGRQELSLGSSRLVSIREAPNVRRAFDGARATWAITGKTQLDLLAVRPVNPVLGSFNDRSDDSQALWGGYLGNVATGIAGVQADLYFLGLTRANARFAQGTAQEHRQTVGARLFGKRDGYDLNFEAAYQFGTFGTADIRAWTVASDTGYTADVLPLSPRFGLKANASSGDHDPRDGRLNTFNALFPKLPYFSEANVAAPANLLDLQPNVTLSPRADVHLNLGWDGLWKQARADAFYAPPLTPMAKTAGGNARYIGQQWLLSATWTPTPRITLGANYVHFRAGSALQAAGGRSGDFLNATLQLRF